MKAYIQISLIIGAALLNGCASKEPVKAFSTSAESFLKTFDGFASRAKDTCQLKYRYMDLDNEGSYDAEPGKETYKNECADYDQVYKGLKLYSTVVSTYASSLGKLAGIEPSVFGDDIDGISKQIASWEVSGGGNVNADAVNAATKLIKSASEAVVGLMVERRIKKELKDNHESLVTVVRDMKVFASNIQKNHLIIAKGYAKTSIAQLVELSHIPGNENGEDQFSTILQSGTLSKEPKSTSGARLPYRILQSDLYRQVAIIDQEVKALTLFSESCDALVKAHLDLKDNFGKLDKEEMLKKVKEFYDKAKEARANFIALNAM